MTKYELSQLYDLSREINNQEIEIKQLDNQIEQVKNCKKRLNENLVKRTKERDRLIAYIETIDDSMIRQILTLRYVKCMPWRVVASRVGGSNTEDSVRKIHDRFILKK